MDSRIETGRSGFRVVFTLLMIVGFFGWLDSCLRPGGIAGQKIAPVQTSVNPGIANANYNPSLVCDDAWTSSRDLSEQSIDHFEVKLREGCFGEKIILPNSWSKWSSQHGSTGPQGWVAIWWDGINPGGPWGLDEASSQTIDWWVNKGVRLQGKGSLIFYKIQ